MPLIPAVSLKGFKYKSGQDHIIVKTDVVLTLVSIYVHNKKFSTNTQIVPADWTDLKKIDFSGMYNFWTYFDQIWSG